MGETESPQPESKARKARGKSAVASGYRPLPPQCERALSAGYWPGQTTPPVRTGPARTCRSAAARPRHLLARPRHEQEREREITPSSHRLSTLPAWVWCCPQAGGPLRSGGLAAAADLPNEQAGLVPGGHQALSAATALGCLCSAQNQAHQMRGCCGARHPMEKTGTQESQPSRGQGRQRGPGRGGGLPGAWDGATGPAWSSQLSQRPACRRE